MKIVINSLQETPLFQKAMSTQEIKAVATKYIVNTYGDRPIALVRGKGVRVWDPEGKEYLDFVAGIAVNLLGHCHPKVIDAVKKQIETLIHVSNLYYIEPQVKVAQILCELSFGQKCFFCNSGAEANEGAFKLARKYAKTHFSEDKYEIISLENSFHGRTYAALTATGQPKYHKGFEPLVPGFHYAKLNNLDSIKEKISSKTCAVIIEPVQGESGIYPASTEFLKGVRQLCDENNALLIYDEVQCGLGRTGKFFAYEYSGIQPDIMTLAKGLAGGVPMGAFVTTDKVASAFSPGNHAATFGGNPLSSAAAYATLATIRDEKLTENSAKIGEFFIKQLQAMQSKFPFMKEIRGMGLMIGIQMDRSCGDLVKKCMAQGLLCNCAADTTLRFVPPLIVTQDDIEEALGILTSVFQEVK